MSLIKSLILGCVLGVVTFCYVPPTRTLAQTGKPAESAQGDHDQTLQQLLTEVRELRLAIQRATVTNTRFQMLIERVRIQQGHADGLSRRLEDLRSQATNMRTEKSQTETRLKIDEELLDRTPDPERHTELESLIKAMKGALSRLAQEGEQLRDREAASNMELQTAQARLDELNSQLDALLNELKVP
jgi:chromosome segregation ATPase